MKIVKKIQSAVMFVNDMYMTSNIQNICCGHGAVWLRMNVFMKRC
jgi:hypothetical protein